jgi:dTDP-4-dehydrorhamnose reductase
MEMLEEGNKPAIRATSRLENVADVASELDRVKPRYVLNAAGLTGRPNIDWCEDHKLETVRVNVLGTLHLVDACNARGIHVTNFATGCIYNYDEKTDHRMGGKPFSEDDAPNWTQSYYSVTKTMSEQLIAPYPNVLTLRLRMPISETLHPRSFVTKIASYPRLVNFPNSVTILKDMLPLSLEMTEREIKGVFNFTNPGAITHNEVMELYKEYVDPTKTWENFTVEEQALILKSGRCNCHLDVSKLQAVFPDRQLPDIHSSLKACFQRIKESL